MKKDYIVSIDTVLIKIKILEESFTGECYQIELMDKIEEALNHIKYCDSVKRIKSRKEKPIEEINFRFSYPRARYENNAYLMGDYKECIKIQKEFINYLSFVTDKFVTDKWVEDNMRICICRVDIPFTYIPIRYGDQLFFNQKNIIKLLSQVYQISLNEASVKLISKYENKNGEDEEKLQTAILSPSSNAQSVNKKINFYDQKAKYNDIYPNRPQVIKEIEETNDKFSSRVRIEVMNRYFQTFTFKEFKKIDIFSVYSCLALKYLLKTLFNEEELNKVVGRNQKLLEKNLLERKSYCRYYEFIYENLDIIYDYEILRKAIMNVEESKNTGYKICSEMREILERISEKNKIFYFNRLDIINDMITVCKKELNRIKKRIEKNRRNKNDK